MWEPWATLAVAPDPANSGEPAKRHETRHWRPREDELPMCVAVHAAKRYDGEVRYALGLPRFRAALERVRYYDPHQQLATGRHFPGSRPLIFGGIIGLAIVTGIYGTRELSRPHALAGELSEDDKTFGNWEPGRWAWRLEHTILLPEPLEHTGRQQVLYPLGAHEQSLIFSQFPR